MAWVLLAASLAAGDACADWKRDYDLGVKAAEAGKWAEVEALMRSAIAEDPAPNARKRFQGAVFKVYVPHYYAGLAAYRQGKCEAALELWRNAASSAVVSGIADLSATQARGVDECSRRLAAAQTPAAPAGTAGTPASSPAGSVAAAPATRPSVPPSRPPASATPATTPPASTPSTTSATRPVQPPPAAAPPAARAPAPAALVAVVEQYLAGRYEAVVQFDPASLADGRARAQAFLLRAAARHVLSELAAGGDARAQQLAQQDVRAARTANASLMPDEVMFSPRFRAFWRQTR